MRLGKAVGRKHTRKTLLIVTLAIVGTCVLLYPLVNTLINNYNQSYVSQEYSKSVQALSKSDSEAELERAHAYNESLISGVITDPFASNVVNVHVSDDAYKDLLDVNSVMGILSIPKIDLKLPIYHGTSDDILDEGVGHLYGTSLPVGGEGTHAVLTGHRGLPTATLFTDLGELEEGDIFSVSVMGETLTYQVDQIKVVEPNDTRDLQIVQGEDYVTLLTCTPYGINTHRLLVRGTHIPTVVDIAVPDDSISSMPWWPVAVAAALVFAGIPAAIRRRRQRRKGAS